MQILPLILIVSFPCTDAPVVRVCLPIILRSGESPADSTSIGFHLCSSLTWKCFHPLWDSLTLSDIQCFLARTVLIRSLDGKIGLFDESPLYLYLSLSPYVQQTIFKMLISRQKKSQRVVGMGGQENRK